MEEKGKWKEEKGKGKEKRTGKEKERAWTSDAPVSAQSSFSF